MSDEKIILAIRNRDEAIMADVIQKYSKLLWSIASAILINASSVQDVEECVADAFIHLWQSPEKYDPEKGKLSSWLSMVTRSKAIDRYRQVVRKCEVPIEEELVQHSGELLVGIVAKEEHEALITCIEKLETQDKEIVVRRYYYEQKPKEIAVALGMPKKLVENRLYQAKQKLRKMLEM